MKAQDADWNIDKDGRTTQDDVMNMEEQGGLRKFSLLIMAGASNLPFIVKKMRGTVNVVFMWVGSLNKE